MQRVNQIPLFECEHKGVAAVADLLFDGVEGLPDELF